VAAAQEEIERQQQADRRVLDVRERAEVLALATDVPRLWRDPHTPQRDRKRMARLLLEDVTLRKGDAIVAQIRFKGGATQILSVPLPPPLGFRRRTDAEVVGEIDHLLDDHTCDEIAAQLNARGWRSFEGKVFHAQMVVRLRRDHGLRDRYSRLRAAGLLTLDEVAATMGVCPGIIKLWRGRGLMRAYRYNEKGEYLYARPDSNLPAKWQRKLPNTTRLNLPAVRLGAPSSDEVCASAWLLGAAFTCHSIRAANSKSCSTLYVTDGARHPLSREQGRLRCWWATR